MEYIKTSNTPDLVSKLCNKLEEIKAKLEKRHADLENQSDINSLIGARLMLDDVMEYIYKDFRGIIPYNRIGLSIISYSGKNLKSVWAITDNQILKLGMGYSQPIKRSSLEKIIKSGNPRIINDLNAYFQTHKNSESTKLILSEGIRSSLTLPLFIDERPFGLLFFSSNKSNNYKDCILNEFLKFSNLLSIVIYKAIIISELAKREIVVHEIF